MTTETTTDFHVERQAILARLNALNEDLPDDAREAYDKVRAVLAERDAERGRLRGLLDEIDTKFQITTRRADEARAQAAAETRHQLDTELMETAEAMFSAIEQAQLHFQAAIENVNAAIVANGKVRAIGRQIAPNDKTPMGLALPDFLFRMGGRVSAMLKRVKIPGVLVTNRLGPLDLPADILSPKGDMSSDYDWVAKERRTQGSAVDELLRHGRGE